MRSLSLLPSAPYLPTASELRIAGECVAPWALGLPEERETNEWAEFGQKHHRYSERLVGNGNVLGHWDTIVRGVDDATKALLENVYTLLHIDLGDAKTFRWPDGKTVALRPEAGVKWRSDGFDDEAELCARAPGERLRGWFAGTADLVYVRADGLLVVIDWKFGPREHVTGEPAKESCQGFFLTLAFATLLEVRGSSADVVVARFERRMVSENGIEVDAYDITQGELDDFAAQLGGLAERIENGVDAAPKISAACGKCKAKVECSAWEALKSALLARASGDAALLDTAPQTTEEARFRRDAMESLKGMLEAIKEHYGAYLALHKDGVLIGLGMREVGKRIERQNLIVSDASIARIRERWGDAAFGAPKPTIGRIEAAEKAKKKQWSKTDWANRKAEIRSDMRADGLLLAPSVYTQAVTQRLVASKWVDVKPEKRDSDEEETED